MALRNLFETMARNPQKTIMTTIMAIPVAVMGSIALMEYFRQNPNDAGMLFSSAVDMVKSTFGEAAKVAEAGHAIQDPDLREILNAATGNITYPVNGADSAIQVVTLAPEGHETVQLASNNPQIVTLESEPMTVVTLEREPITVVQLEREPITVVQLEGQEKEAINPVGTEKVAINPVRPGGMGGP